tara:strand:- start:1155 stop:1898 length:744 start_codon:yes stop_codon:yes gene_type:complete
MIDKNKKPETESISDHDHLIKPDNVEAVMDTKPLSIFGRIRGYFLAGVLVSAPLGITGYLAWAMITFIDHSVTPLIPESYNPETYLPFSLPGLGVLVLVITLTLVGALTAGLFGRWILRTGERILNRMPVIRSLYSTIKQIFETVLAQKSNAFRDAVLVEYPRKGLWTIAFVTGETEGEIKDLSDFDAVNIYVPTTPNPTSGFLLFVPRKDLVALDMSVEEAIKMVISGGLVTPSHSPLAKPKEIQS